MDGPIVCGRYAFTKTDDKALKKRFGLAKVPAKLKPRYNIAPSQDVAVVLNESPTELTFARWGLIPSWARAHNTQYSMINAKAETVTEKPAYRGPIRHKRCLIVADAFFEWQRADGAKRPYRIFMKDGEPFAFAGLWDVWEKNGAHVVSCSIITTGANALIRGIHERMPVILRRDDETAWLEEKSLDKVLGLLRPFDAAAMDAYEISTAVNSPENDSPDVLRRA